jgi:hypothetical protein
VRTDPAIAIVVDVCDLATGLVSQVIARGRAEILPFDVAHGRLEHQRVSRWAPSCTVEQRFPPVERPTVTNLTRAPHRLIHRHPCT